MLLGDKSCRREDAEREGDCHDIDTSLMYLCNSGVES